MAVENKVFLMLGVKCKASYLLGKHYTTELNPQSQEWG
jgi:hypothetical protein